MLPASGGVGCACWAWDVAAGRSGGDELWDPALRLAVGVEHESVVGFEQAMRFLKGDGLGFPDVGQGVFFGAVGLVSYGGKGVGGDYPEAGVCESLGVGDIPW